VRRVLGLAAGLALIGAALSPPAPAQATCTVAAVKKCQGHPLIDIDVAVRATPHAHPGGRVTYVLNYSMTWTPSFAPYWGAFWVGGRFPKGAQTPSKATFFDATGKKLATIPCRRHSDGVWCDTGGQVPHHGQIPRQGKIVFTARLAPKSGGAAVAKLGVDSFEGLNEAEFARHYSRKRSQEKFCNHRFAKAVTTTVLS
jgi:hypothetical protein